MKVFPEEYKVIALSKFTIVQIVIFLVCATIYLLSTNTLAPNSNIWLHIYSALNALPILLGSFGFIYGLKVLKQGQYPLPGTWALSNWIVLTGIKGKLAGWAMLFLSFPITIFGFYGLYFTINYYF